MISICGDGMIEQLNFFDTKSKNGINTNTQILRFLIFSQHVELSGFNHNYLEF